MATSTSANPKSKFNPRAKEGTVAQFRVKGETVYQEAMVTFVKAGVILDMFKDFGIGCGMPPDLVIDPIIIPLPHVTPECFEALVRWCYHHKDETDMTTDDLRDNLYYCTGQIKDKWDIQHYDSLDEDVLFDLLIAAKYLGLPEMRDSLTTYIANALVEEAENKTKGKKSDDDDEAEEDEMEEEEDDDQDAKDDAVDESKIMSSGNEENKEMQENPNVLAASVVADAVNDEMKSPSSDTGKKI